MTKREALLSIEALKKALEKLDWPKAQALLDAAGVACNPVDVAEALRRAGRLVLTHPTEDQAKRDDLFAALKGYMAKHAPTKAVPDEITRATETIEIAEAGYRKLLELLKKTDASKMEATIHVASAIARADEEIAYVGRKMNEALAKQDGMAINTPPLDDMGIPLDLDGTLERCNAFVSMTLKLEAYKHGWTTDEGEIIVPVLPKPTKEDIFLVGENLHLCVLWQRWSMTEQRARVMGRTLRFLDDKERPPGTPDKILKIVVEDGDIDNDAFYRIALERLMDKLTQNFIEIRKSVRSTAFAAEHPTAQMVHLPPQSWLSYEEFHTVWSVEQMLGYSILSDDERPGGLRLIEWIRGYAALMLLSRNVQAGNETRTKAGWQHFFSGYGLSADVSSLLLRNLTFRRSSRDLFDHPFLKMSNGQYRLMASAVRHSSLPVVLFSTLGHLGATLEKKGKGFESKVREVFEAAGIKAYSFTAKREGNEYEYDVVVPWDDHLFVFECKNRVLPFGSPEQMHYFDLDVSAGLSQLTRLIDGLKHYPDIIATNLPEGTGYKTIVPVLLNSYPFCAPGPRQGGYLYDYSALSRFFLNGEVELKAAHVAGGIETLPTGIKLWKGDAPTAEDLVQQLRLAHQFESMAKSIKLDDVGFPLPLDWWVLGTTFTRSESTELRMAWARASKAQVVVATASTSRPET